MQSKPTFLNDAGEDICVFCKNPMPTKSIRGLVVEVGYCTCEAAKKHRAEYERKRQERLDEYRESQRLRRYEESKRASMIPARWGNRGFNCFEETDENKKAYEDAMKYAQNFNPSDGHGLLIIGPVGTGKTHLAAAITLSLLEKEYKAVFGTVTSLLGQIRNTFDDQREREQDVFNKLTQCDLLVIDDIGKERTTEWVEQTLFEIVNNRYENNKALIITSNIGISDIRTKYPNVGEAMSSRIIEMCKGIKIAGPDWRKKAII